MGCNIGRYFFPKRMETCSSASEDWHPYHDEAKCGRAFGTFTPMNGRALLQMVAGLEVIYAKPIIFQDG